ARAMQILKKDRKVLDAVSQKLIDQESLDADEFVKIVGKDKQKFEYSPLLKPSKNDKKPSEDTKKTTAKKK
ncbi:hypothetical protein KC721_03850, partial [Candidatus Woesebacteria bacterium]|nr:hypothetical protein [Candidatus Woesebacteria bacterium]